MLGNLLYGDVTEALFALVESTPELAADRYSCSLADDMTAVAERIAFGRAQIQDAIADYNTLIQRLPLRAAGGGAARRLGC